MSGLVETKIKSSPHTHTHIEKTVQKKVEEAEEEEEAEEVEEAEEAEEEEEEEGKKITRNIEKWKHQTKR